MSKKVKKPRVFAYGCSLTAGAELLDHVFHPDSERLKQQGVDLFMQTHRLPHHEQHLKVMAEERQLTWAGQLARLWGKPLINQAVSGSSLAYSVYALERDRALGLVTARDTVLVGITTRERVTCFGHGEHHMILGRGADCLPPDCAWDYHTIVDLYQDRDLELIYTEQLLRLVQIAETQPLYMVNMWWREGDPDPVALARWREISRSPSWVNGNSLYDFALEDPHAGGHPRVEAHSRFAKWLSRKIPPCLPERRSTVK